MSYSDNSNILQLLNSDVSWNIGKSDCNVENIYTKCLYINNEKIENSTRNIVFRQSDLDTHLTNDTGINNIQSPTNYKLIIQPTNTSSKFRIQLKIGYIIGFRDNQKISFALFRAIGDATSTNIYTDLRFTVGEQQDVAFLIYTLDHIDTITNGNSNLSPITYQLKFMLEGTFSGGGNNGNPCGIIGVDGDNGTSLGDEIKSLNSMIVEEIPSGISEYVPPFTGIVSKLQYLNDSTNTTIHYKNAPNDGGTENTVVGRFKINSQLSSDHHNILWISEDTDNTPSQWHVITWAGASYAYGAGIYYYYGGFLEPEKIYNLTSIQNNDEIFIAMRMPWHNQQNGWSTPITFYIKKDTDTTWTTKTTTGSVQYPWLAREYGFGGGSSGVDNMINGNGGQTPFGTHSSQLHGFAGTITDAYIFSKLLTLQQVQSLEAGTTTASQIGDVSASDITNYNDGLAHYSGT